MNGLATFRAKWNPPASFRARSPPPRQTRVIISGATLLTRTWFIAFADDNLNWRSLLEAAKHELKAGGKYHKFLELSLNLFRDALLDGISGLERKKWRLFDYLKWSHKRRRDKKKPQIIYRYVNIKYKGTCVAPAAATKWALTQHLQETLRVLSIYFQSSRMKQE